MNYLQMILNILKSLGGVFTSLGRADLAEDSSLLAGAIGAFLTSPFDLHTSMTWIAMGAAAKAVVSIGSNLKIAFFSAINVNDLLEDFSLLGGAVASLFVAPFDPKSAVSLLALGAVAKALLSILATLNLIKPAQTVLVAGEIRQENKPPTPLLFTAPKPSNVATEGPLKKPYKPILRVDPK